MSGRFQPTESGFIMEGEVRPTEISPEAACSVYGAELDAHWHSAHRSLLEALKELEGRNVRITVEVVERGPVDALRELLERFRRESEDLEEYPSVI